MELVQNLRFGLRTLRRSPGFTIVATLTLAFGIAANTAIFSVVNRLLLRPLPYEGSRELVTLWEHNLANQRNRNSVSAGNFAVWRDQAQSFAGIAAFSNWTFNLTGTGEPERVPAKVVSANLFSLLRVQLAAGRLFRADEDQPGSERVIILSHGLWQRRFGGDAAILGRPITLDGGSRTVVGVLPPGFEFPGTTADIWAPLILETGAEAFNGRWLQVLGRLKPGVTVASAKAELIALADRIRSEHPQNSGWSANVITLKETLVSDFQRELLILLGAVGLLLLIACANVANLLLVRAAGRERELTVRIALGATRAQLIGQLLSESLCLAGIAGVTGLLGAYWAVNLLRNTLPAELRVPGFATLGIDLGVIGFTLAVTLGSGLVFGLIPALTTSRVNLHEPLRGTGRSTATAHRARFRDALVVVEVALALVLLLGAGLLLRSFGELEKVNPGFQPSNLLEARISLPGNRYPESARQVEFFGQLEERLAGLPGVEEVGAISFLPLSGDRSASGFVVEGRPAPAAGQEPVGDMRAVTPGYFNTMGIPVLRGRNLSRADQASAPSVTLISETLARTMFPGEDPIGKRLAYDWDDHVSAEIVGITGDVHHSGLATAPHMEIYRPVAQFPYSSMSVVLRTTGEPAAISSLVRREVHTIDPDQPVGSLTPMTTLLRETLAKPRLNTLMLGLFAVVGLLLASIGIYGLLSYVVAQRSREIGIRLALGANAGNVLRLVVGHGMSLTLAGIGIGLTVSLLLARVLNNLLYGVAPRDPLTFVAVPMVLLAVALAACAVPAWRATRVDPVRAMKGE